jgi:hypothetical protein
MRRAARDGIRFSSGTKGTEAMSRIGYKPRPSEEFAAEASVAPSGLATTSHVPPTRGLRPWLLAVAPAGLTRIAVGGTENHVHLCLEIPPTVLISELIGQLKGASSHDVNQHFGHRGKVLQWQTGYGVVTFGARDRDWMCGYIRNQREHHARGTIQDRLERITQPDDEKAQAAAARRPVNGPPVVTKGEE